MSKLINFCKNVVFIFKALLAWFLFLPIILLLFPFCVWNFFVLLWVRIFHPSFRPISYTETFLACDNLTQKEANCSGGRLTNMGICLELEASSAEVDVNQFALTLEKNFIENPELHKYVWRLKSEFVRFGGYTFLKETSDFSIHNHIRMVNLPADQNLVEYLQTWLRQSYKTQHCPLWEFIIVKHNSKEYVAAKIHHALADAMTLIQMVGTVFRKEGYTTKIIQQRKEASSGLSLFEKMDFVFKIPLLLFAASRLRSQEIDPLEFDSGTEAAQLTSAQTLSLIDLKAVAKKHGVQLQSVLLTVLSGVIRQFLESRGKSIPEYVVVITAQLRQNRPPNFIGNHFNVIDFPIPLKITDPLKRLSSIEAGIQRIYARKLHLIVHVFEALFSLLPVSLVRHVHHQAKARYTLSPLLLPGEYMYEGRAMTPVLGLPSITMPKMGMLSVLISYKDKITWTLTGAKNLFNTKDNLDILASQYIMQEVKALLTSDSLTNSEAKLDHMEVNIQAQE